MAPEMAKKPLCFIVWQLTPSLFQICKEVQILAVEGGGDDYL